MFQIKHSDYASVGCTCTRKCPTACIRDRRVIMCNAQYISIWKDNSQMHKEHHQQEEICLCSTPCDCNLGLKQGQIPLGPLMFLGCISNRCFYKHFNHLRFHLFSPSMPRFSNCLGKLGSVWCLPFRH